MRGWPGGPPQHNLRRADATPGPGHAALVAAKFDPPLAATMGALSHFCSEIYDAHIPVPATAPTDFRNTISHTQPTSRIAGALSTSEKSRAGDPPLVGVTVHRVGKAKLYRLVRRRNRLLR